MKTKTSCAILSLVLAAGLAVYAEDAAASGDASGDDALFGEEQVTEASTKAQEPDKAFMKYDATKVGGSITSTLGYSAVYMEGADSIVPDYDYLSPTVMGRVTLTAKPALDFGVNMDFRMSYPYSSSVKALTSPTGTTATITEPSISVWALYSKFSVGDRLYMSFGKQPMAWGVARGFFQPADNIFAESAVDYSDYSAEREGPLAFKAMYSVPKSMTNFYFLAGLPSSAASNPQLEDLRMAAKAEFNAGNTEFAFGAFYGYNDHPRVLAMATTGVGAFNLYGEAIGKYDTAASGAEGIEAVLFSGTLGGYYTADDGDLTILGQYYYNGEDVSAAKNSAHYAFLSISRAEFLNNDFTVGLSAISNLSDLSGILIPSATWAFTDYFKLKLQASLNFGEAGDQFIMIGPDFQSLARTGAIAKEPGVALSLLATLGTGSF